jgi:hypothetical protein
MSDKNTGWMALLRLASQVDWPRVIHRGALLVRELRGDEQIDADSDRVRTSARAARDTMEKMGRASVGCLKPAPCSCPFCKEERGQ